MSQKILFLGLRPRKTIFLTPISYRRFSLQPNTVLLYYCLQFVCSYPEKTKNEIFYNIRMYYAPFSMPKIKGVSLYRCFKKKKLSKLVNLKMIYQHFKFRAVNGMFYCPKLVPGSKNTFSARNFTFSAR